LIDDWPDWFIGTTQTQAECVGRPGHHYAFRARAADNVSNIGEWVEASVSVVQVFNSHSLAHGDRLRVW
jgi:hypothetical protein